MISISSVTWSDEPLERFAICPPLGGTSLSLDRLIGFGLAFISPVYRLITRNYDFFFSFLLTTAIFKGKCLSCERLRYGKDMQVIFDFHFDSF